MKNLLCLTSIARRLDFELYSSFHPLLRQSLGEGNVYMDVNARMYMKTFTDDNEIRVWDGEV